MRAIEGDEYLSGEIVHKSIIELMLPAHYNFLLKMYI